MPAWKRALASLSAATSAVRPAHRRLTESCWHNVTDVAWGFSLTMDDGFVDLWCTRCPGGGCASRDYDLSWRTDDPFPMGTLVGAMRRHHREHHSDNPKAGNRCPAPP